MTTILKLENFLEFKELLHKNKFPENAFDLLGKSLTAWLEGFLTELGCIKDEPKILGKVHSSAVIEGQVYIHETAKVEPGAYIQGPCYIGPESEVRHGAYIRGSVYVGKHCVVGHATEIKGSCLFDGAKAAHFAYVGDSILGTEVNLGAGTRLANFKMAKNEVSYKHPETDAIVKSGLRKFGAILGHNAQTGCNAVLSPGSILMRNTGVYPCVHFHGTLNNGFVK